MLADSFWSALLQVDVISVILACAIPITAIISVFWYKTQKARSQDALKQSMVERGMPVEEIERIIAAQPDKHQQLK